MSKGLMTVLDTGIFSAKILFCVNFSYDEIMEELTKQGCDGWVASLQNDKELIDGGKYFGLSRTLEVDGEMYYHYHIIFTGEFDFSDKMMCFLAHEILHVCQFFMKDLLDMEREYECVAYTHTHIMKQCLKHMRETYCNPIDTTKTFKEWLHHISEKQ